MKTKPIKTILAVAVAVTAIAAFTFVSCKKDNKVEPAAANTSTGSDVFDASIGGLAFLDRPVLSSGVITNVPVTAQPTYTVAGTWKLDKSHSNVMWETQYYATGAQLTGRFNMFEIKCKFDQANPANTTIIAWVALHSFNTGEPGREGFGPNGASGTADMSDVRWDNSTGKVTTNTAVATSKFYKQGCAMGSMGVKFDTAKVGGLVQAPLPIYTPRTQYDFAFFTSTACVKSGDGYVVTGDFYFRGITKSINMNMTYKPKTTTTNATTGKKTDRAGLQGEFWINANTVFGVNSGSINDLVKIRVDANFVSIAY